MSFKAKAGDATAFGAARTCLGAAALLTLLDADLDLCLLAFLALVVLPLETEVLLALVTILNKL